MDIVTFCYYPVTQLTLPQNRNTNYEMKDVSLSQILGFDILLMKNLKPVLLEVNSNPSMRIEHEQEVRVNIDVALILV